MRKKLLACLLALSALRPAHAQTATDRTEIQRVITAQIDAFRRDDAAAAFAFAAPAIQSKFGDAPHFLAMVRDAYTVVFRPSTVSFGALVIANGREIQKLELTGPHGREALALYDMVQDPPGTWRIAGCVLAASEGVSL